MTAVVSPLMRFAFQRSASIRYFSSRPKRVALEYESIRRIPSVRLISESGEDRGVMPGKKAASEAKKAHLDVIQVRSTDPPVLRLLNLKEAESERRRKDYEKRKSQKENIKMQRRENTLKQVRLSPATDKNDISIKMKQVRNFLSAGYRVRLYMQFRRGHGALADNAKETLIQLSEELQDIGILQGVPPGGTVADLFKKPENDDDEDEEVQKKSKKPLQLQFNPLPRKERLG